MFASLQSLTLSVLLPAQDKDIFLDIYKALGSCIILLKSRAGLQQQIYAHIIECLASIGKSPAT